MKLGAARIQVLAAALLFSTGGAAIKLASLSGWQIACFRSAVAAIVLWLALPAWRHLGDRRVLLPGLAYGATLVLFVLATTLTTAAAAIFLQSSAVVYVLVLAPRLLGEPSQRFDGVLVAVFAAGILLVFAGTDVPLATARDPGLGNLIGAASGATWGATLLGLRWLGRAEPAPRHDPAGAAVLAGNGMAFAACLPFAFPLGPSTPIDWGVVGYLGVFQVGLAYVCLVRGVRGTRALEASLLLALEPVLNALFSGWIHGEWPGPLATGGCGLILVGMVGQALRATRPRQP